MCASKPYYLEANKLLRRSHMQLLQPFRFGKVSLEESLRKVQDESSFAFVQGLKSGREKYISMKAYFGFNLGSKRRELQSLHIQQVELVD